VALYDPDAVIVNRAHREWEALIQLNNARDQLWRLQAVASHVPDPQFGVISILDFAPETITPDMAATVADLDLAQLVSAARQLANLLDQIGQQLPVEYRVAYPGAMARYVLSDLWQLTTAGQTAPRNTC
jgi:hypothetical protein